MSFIPFLQDGVLTEIQETKDCIVRTSDLPLSILIVGVGNADFKQMEVRADLRNPSLEKYSFHSKLSNVFGFPRHIHFVIQLDIHTLNLYVQ